MYWSASANWYFFAPLFKMCCQCDFNVTLEAGPLPVLPVCSQVVLGFTLTYTPVLTCVCLFHHWPPLSSSNSHLLLSSLGKVEKSQREGWVWWLSKQIVTAAFIYLCKYLNTLGAFTSSATSLSGKCLFIALVQGQSVPSGDVKNRLPCN